MARKGRLYPQSRRLDIVEGWTHQLAKNYKNQLPVLANGLGALWPAWAGQLITTGELVDLTPSDGILRYNFISPPGTLPGELMYIEIKPAYNHQLLYEVRWTYTDGAGYSTNNPWEVSGSSLGALFLPMASYGPAMNPAIWKTGPVTTEAVPW